MHAFTVIETANPHPFTRSFVVLGVLNGLLAVALLVWLGPPRSPEAFGSAMGTLFFPALIAGLVAGFAARRSERAWATWNYALVAIPIDLLFLFGTATG